MNDEGQSLFDGRKETLGINGGHWGPLQRGVISAAREASTVPFDPLRWVEQGGGGIVISDYFRCTKQSCGNQEKTANCVSGYDFHGFAGRERRSAFQMCGLTQGELLPRVRRQRESEKRHRGDENTGHDQVEEIVERPPPANRKEKVSGMIQ